MMQKFTTLKRKDGERLNAYWNRWKGHYAENRIRKDDDIKINQGNTIKPADEDENGERYRLSSDIVACLHMAHPDLPQEVEKMLSAKLENQDVASLEREIFVKANIALEQLERNRPLPVRRTNAQPARQQPRRQPYNTAQSGARGTKTAPRKPTKPEHYCSACAKHPTNKHLASGHYLKD